MKAPVIGFTDNDPELEGHVSGSPWGSVARIWRMPERLTDDVFEVRV